MKNYVKHAVFAVALAGLSFNNVNAQSVLLDSHSDAGGATSWQITTSHANELILISADGYGSDVLDSTAGTVIVNSSNATYITRGTWFNFGNAWTASIWAYVAPTIGTYTISCTETGLDNPFYFNYATAVYDPTAPLGLSNILVGGHDSNQAMTTVTTSITTTVNNSFVYGTTSWNDNGGFGTLSWNGGLTELDHDYIDDGVDCAQADSTIALAGLQTITVTDIGASNPWATITLIAVQPPVCTLSATASIDSNASSCANNGKATASQTGGTSPFTYSWNTSPVQTNTSATGLSAGTYTVTETDASLCSSTASVTITQAPAISINIDSLIMSGCKDSLWAIVTGGNAPYSYKWTPGGSTRDTIGQLCPGNYKIVVTDARGCKDSATVSIITGINEISSLNDQIQLSPNPFSQSFNLDISTRQSVFITMYNMLGENVGDWKINPGHNVINAEEYSPGIYMLQIKTADGRLLNKKIVKVN